MSRPPATVLLRTVCETQGPGVGSMELGKTHGKKHGIHSNPLGFPLFPWVFLWIPWEKHGKHMFLFFFGREWPKSIAK